MPLLKPKTDSIQNSIDVVAQLQFNLAYHRSKDPRLQRAREVAPGFATPKGKPIRHTLMEDLARIMSVDPEIDYDNLDPYLTMRARLATGKTQFDALQPPGAALMPAIRSTINLVDYPPIDPQRSFTQQDYFDTVNVVIELGYIPGNEDRLFVLPGGHPAAAATRANLRGIFPPPPMIAQWQTIPHFGIVINGVRQDGELIIDAEELANQPDEDSARAYIEAQAVA